jgi:hypothetical protein
LEDFICLLLLPQVKSIYLFLVFTFESYFSLN